MDDFAERIDAQTLRAVPPPFRDAWRKTDCEKRYV